MLDEKDQKILAVLKHHADASTRAIAKETLLPITTVHNRIKKLKQKGVIKRFTIETDPNLTDRQFAAYILIKANLPQLREHKRTQYDIISDLKRLENVESTHIISGGADIIAFVRTKDVQSFDAILLQQIHLISGIEDTTTLTVLHE